MGAVTLNRTGKLALTVALFVVAVVLVFVASAVNSTAPLFVAWIPLLSVPWVLTRPESKADLEPEAPQAGDDQAGGAHAADQPGPEGTPPARIGEPDSMGSDGVPAHPDAEPAE